MDRVYKLVLALIILAIIGGLIFLIYKLPKPTNNPFGRPATTIDLSRESVVKEMQSLNRIETASFTIEKVIEAGNQGNTFQNLLYGDRILLIAQGRVIAGVDLSKMKNTDVKVEGTTLTMNMPAPEVLSTSLDSSKTRVYDRKLGLFSKGDKDLEAQARQAAESSITKAACEANILDEAARSARERITQMYTVVGFTNINVIIPSANCQL